MKNKLKRYPIAVVVAEARKQRITSDFCFGERSGTYHVSPAAQVEYGAYSILQGRAIETNGFN